MTAEATHGSVRRTRRYHRDDPRVADLPRDFFDPLDAAFGPLDVVHIAAVTGGAKNGAVLTGLNDDNRPGVSDALDNAGLPHRIYQREKSDDWLAVAATTAAFDLMPPYEEVPNLVAFENDEARQNGQFLGVPEPDNCWQTDLTADFDRPVRPVLEEQAEINAPENDGLLRLLSYLCRPTQAGVDRAIREARSYRETCRRVKDEIGDHRPLHYADRIADNCRTVGSFYHESKF